MTAVPVTDLAVFLADHPPFDTLDPEVLAGMAGAARLVRFRSGELILDAFRDPTTEVFVVLDGRVDLWNSADGVGQPADEQLAPGEVFGFSAMLTERSVGPRAVARTETTVARIPGSAVSPAFTSRRGVRFLAEMVTAAGRRADPTPSYTLVDELITAPPLLVAPDTPAGAVARTMSDRGTAYAAVPLTGGGFGLVTDTVLRQRLLVDGLPPTTRADALVPGPAPGAASGDSAAEAWIELLDKGASYLLVTDRDGDLLGVVSARDFAVSSTTAGVSLHEQLRRTGTVTELAERARRVPAMLGDLLSRGLSSGKVIAVYSSVVDTVVRRAIALTFAERPDLSADAFTWLSLGSNGRREAVLSSDVDSAVAFDDDTPDGERRALLAALGEVVAVLEAAGLSSDGHGTTAASPTFARSNAEWRAAGLRWMAAPEENKGAIMTSLLVDGRPIHGDPGLPAVTRVFGELRSHPGTMRLLLQESLSRRARLRSMRDVLTRRADLFDLKDHALVPVINIARWAALSVGSAVLPTTARLRAASGSAMLPADRAATLIEVFEVLQRLRLRYQLMQVDGGARPSDVLAMDRVSPIDRSVIAQAVREISAIQRRMDNLALYLPPEAWARPDSASG